VSGGLNVDDVFAPTGFHASPDAPRIVVIEDKVVNVKEAEGLEISSETEDGTVRAELRVLPGYEFEEPVHFCVGIPWERGVQRIITRIIVEEGASISLMSHCSFPRAEDVLHEMEAEIILHKDSSLKVTDVHYHGENGVRLRAVYDVDVGPGAEYDSSFKITRGRIGEMEWISRMRVDEGGVVRADAAMKAVDEDVVDVEEVVRLVGENARASLEFKAAAIDGAEVNVVGEISGEADGVRGHVECSEIIKGDGRVSSVPKLRVSHPGARLTHEAALGTIERKEVETLMARGLTEEEAVDLLVEAMLRG